jgi:YtkA-like
MDVSVTGRLLDRRSLFVVGPGKFLLLFLCAVMPMVTACRQSSRREPEISVRFQITPQPVRVGPAAIVIQMSDTAGKPVSRVTIEIEADMAHPGMSPLFGEAEETAPGIYRTYIRFNMRGDWVVLERQVDVRGVQSN